MKKVSALLVLLLALPASVAAQTRYYNESKTFKEDGYTYRCDVIEQIGWVKLYNVDNKWVNTPVMKKGSNEQVSRESSPLWLTEEAGVNALSAVLVPCRKAAMDILDIYKDRLRTNNLYIRMYINPDTGKIGEVYFEFSNLSGYGTLPVSVYRQIEMGLIGKQFTPTAFGKTLNYIPSLMDIEYK